MKSITAFIVLIPFVAAVPPTLHSASSTEIVARSPGNVFVCVEAGFTGHCGNFAGASGQCVNFPSDFNDDITAVGPDDGQDCFFYIDANCSNEQLGPIRSPGLANLRDTPEHLPFNDAISSFKCFFG
ncbi:hypothetical protein B0H10DRAFT_2217616 [Mycena sp. CBHHK59/15]|nr:hypothetical protein B0H10DRAFT_2229916 [Mycena sp. CBHHK59/15]KAJ6613080.1 hypothetical protein B0H10DRAFT_2275825 [Mycena sp. CBHHK59/15]KAJ6618480.1 hypothetical protein B0H10DRAFT_2217616 [Mycena sp. CBHHK59/15]